MVIRNSTHIKRISVPPDKREILQQFLSKKGSLSSPQLLAGTKQPSTQPSPMAPPQYE